jgi:hypothetical protein
MSNHRIRRLPQARLVRCTSRAIVNADHLNVALGAKSLAAIPAFSYILFVSNKQLVSNLLDRLPDDVSLRDIAKEIEFISGVREGLDQLDRGDGVPLEDVEKMIASWTTK